MCGRPLQTPRREGGEQPLEEGGRDEGLVRRPAMAADEDAHVADEVDFHPYDAPARRRRVRRAKEDEQAEEEYQRHDAIVVQRNFGCGRRRPDLHRLLISAVLLLASSSFS